MTDDDQHVHDLGVQSSLAEGEEVEALAAPSAEILGERPSSFKMAIQGGILENLGIRMYENIGKVLVEFAANAYDADAPSIDISLDMVAIEKERKKIVDAAHEMRSQPQLSLAIDSPKKLSRRPRRNAEIDTAPLPREVKITVSDSGHGMTAKEMLECFLPLNRNRRKQRPKDEESNFYSEGGKRLVMGRKGIGKLSAFGVAERMTVSSKRRGQSFWTTLTLDAESLRTADNISQIDIPHTYSEAPEQIDVSGTKFVFEGLLCGSMNFSLDDISSTLNETFQPITKEEYSIKINGNELVRLTPEIAYRYPEDIEPDKLKFETITQDWGSIDIKYRVQFTEKRLDNHKRGIYLYSKKRLVMAPSLLDLTTGMHNFMAQQYLQMIVECDDLDNLNVDLIATSRNGIARDNIVVKHLFSRLTEIMKEAIAANSKFKDGKADQDIDKAPEAEALRKMLEVISPRQKQKVRALAKHFIAIQGLDNLETLTPLIAGAANAGDILIELVKAANNAETIKDLAPHIIALREIEQSDTIKIFRARRRGIEGLRRVVRKGDADFGKGPHEEKELHKLLKAQPWLIRPELSSYVSSDVTMATTLARLVEHLKIDEHAPDNEIYLGEVVEDTESEQFNKQTKRPDLVSIIGDAAHPNRIFVCELKAPTVPLTSDHLNQLKTYITKIEEFFESTFSGPRGKVVVEGALIGTLPKPVTRSDKQRLLLSEINKKGPEAQWEVLSLTAMLERTEHVHRDWLQAIDADEREDRVDADLPD